MEDTPALRCDTWLRCDITEVCEPGVPGALRRDTADPGVSGMRLRREKAEPGVPGVPGARRREKAEPGVPGLEDGVPGWPYGRLLRTLRGLVGATCDDGVPGAWSL